MAVDAVGRPRRLLPLRRSLVLDAVRFRLRGKAGERQRRVDVVLRRRGPLPRDRHDADPHGRLQSPEPVGTHQGVPRNHGRGHRGTAGVAVRLPAAVERHPGPRGPRQRSRNGPARPRRGGPGRRPVDRRLSGRAVPPGLEGLRHGTHERSLDRTPCRRARTRPAVDGDRGARNPDRAQTPAPCHRCCAPRRARSHRLSTVPAAVRTRRSPAGGGTDVEESGLGTASAHGGIGTRRGHRLAGVVIHPGRQPERPDPEGLSGPLWRPGLGRPVADDTERQPGPEPARNSGLGMGPRPPRAAPSASRGRPAARGIHRSVGPLEPRTLRPGPRRQSRPARELAPHRCSAADPVAGRCPPARLRPLCQRGRDPGRGPRRTRTRGHCRTTSPVAIARCPGHRGGRRGAGPVLHPLGEPRAREMA